MLYPCDDRFNYNNAQLTQEQVKEEIARSLSEMQEIENKTNQKLSEAVSLLNQLLNLRNPMSDAT